MRHMVFILHLRWLAASTIRVLAASQLRCMKVTICCICSEIPAVDEELIYSKHVEGYY
jgi:hypothetical protein